MPGDLAKRATTAFYRSAVRHGDRLPPASPVPATVTYQDTTYVLLRAGPEILALYKVMPTGNLKRLYRLPQGIAEGQVTPS